MTVHALNAPPPCDFFISFTVSEEAERWLLEAADLFRATIKKVGDAAQVMLQECGLRTFLTYTPAREHAPARLTLAANSPDGDLGQQYAACACAVGKMGALAERISGQYHAKQDFWRANLDAKTTELLNFDEFGTGTLRSALAKWCPALDESAA